MKILTILLCTFASIAAQAEFITCVFTEPFVTATYNSRTMSLVYTGPDIDQLTLHGAYHRVNGNGTSQVMSSDGRTMLSLLLNYQGSDGMSDRIYSYTVKATLPLQGVAQLTEGGCDSDLIPTIMERRK